MASTASDVVTIDSIIVNYQYDAQNSDDSMVTVNFIIDLPIPKIPVGLPAGFYTHYKLFLDFGDGTYDKDTINFTGPSDSRIKTDTINGTLVSFLEETYVHIYSAMPTHPFHVSATKIKSTDHVPPPSNRAMINDTTGMPSDLKENFNLLPLATTKRLFDENKKNVGVPTVPDNIRLQFIAGPVRQNEYNGILELSNDTNLVLAGTVLLHFNLPDFFDALSDFDLKVEDIRTWKNEEVSIIELGPNQTFYPNLDSSGLDFSHLIRINFDSLYPFELRRIMLPFKCPEKMGENLFKPVLFLGIVMDSSQVDPFRQKVKDFADFNQSFSSGTSNSTSGGITGTPGAILDTILIEDFVREGYDPNSIIVKSTCINNNQVDLIGIVNFENYGAGAVNQVTIRIPVPDYLIAGSIQLAEAPSIGIVKFADTLTINDRLYYQIILGDMYLAGTREIALEENIDISNTFCSKANGTPGKITICNYYGAITQGFIEFRARTKDLGNALKSFLMTVEIQFDDQERIEHSQDKLLYNPYLGGGALLQFGAKLSINFPFPGSRFANNWSVENFTFGGFIDFHPFSCGQLNRFTLRGEASYYRMGLKNKTTNANITHESLEIALLLRYQINRFSIGIGANTLQSVKWKQNKSLPEGAFSRGMTGYFLDLGSMTNNNRLGFGARGYLYPQTIIDGPPESNLFVFQAYMTYRFLNTF